METIFYNNITKDSPYKINIPLTVENKIRFICTESWDTEWSGILFYTYTGDFETNDLEINCKDICVLDIGSAMATEFDMNQEVINYMAKNNLLDCQIGLIHSHNNMASFFSGTDIDTLQSEGNSRNNFVSLIVNNKGLYSAAITRKITLNQGTSNLFDKEATNINYGISIIQAFKLNVVIENSNFSKLKQVLNQLKQSKKPITPINTYNKSNQHSSLTPNTEVNKKDTSIKKPILKTSKLDNEVISLMYQLITGSIVINHDSNINIKDWILKLPTIYSKRFKNMKDFEYWIELYSEYLFFNIEDDINGEKMPKYATMILEELENYATNTYLDYIKFILHSYIDFNYADE